MPKDDKLSQIRPAELKNVSKKKYDKENKENVCLQKCSCNKIFKELNPNDLNKKIAPEARDSDELNRTSESLKDTTS